jgi:hypothetical protein
MNGRSASGVLRAVFALAAIAATLMWGRLAHADAAPVQLVLLYMPHVSNVGSTSATGVAELVMSEGEVRIKVADLPRLDGQQYVLWVVNSSTNDFQRLGSFNTAAATGAVDYETVEPDAIPDKSWNLLLVTIEGSAKPDSPSDQHSIAGVFPNADDAPLPMVLPNTGGAPDEPYQDYQHGRPEWLGFAGLVALVGSMTFGAGFALGRKRR